MPGNLFAIDLATGVGTLVGVLPDGPYLDGTPGYNEIESGATSGRAWAQQRAANAAVLEVGAAILLPWICRPPLRPGFFPGGEVANGGEDR